MFGAAHSQIFSQKILITGDWIQGSTGYLVLRRRLLGFAGTDAGGPATESCKSQHLLDVT